MIRLFTISLLLIACVPGCTRRAQSNSTCEWPQETAISIDVSKPTQRRHLSDDAQFAEDLAIRHADSRRGQRSGHFEGWAEYRQTREKCLAALFDVIGKNHGVTEEQVRQSLLYRRTSLDLAVILSFAVFYGLAANGAARRVCRRFPTDEGWLAAVVITVITSAVISTGGVLLGDIWSLTAENVRVGNGHLSYRVNRVPWTRRHLALFIGGVVLFWFLAALHYRAAVRVAKHPGAREKLRTGAENAGLLSLGPLH
jgi:hypothetical protein